MGYRMPDNLAIGGNRVDGVGRFHACCIRFDEQPTSKAGALLDGVRPEFSILAGTDPSQVKKTIDGIFYNPDLKRSVEDQDKANLKLVRLAKSLDSLPEVKAGEEFDSFNWGNANGRQCVITVREQQEKTTDPNTGKEKWVNKMGDNGKPFVGIAAVHWLGEEGTEDVPLCEKSLKLIGLTKAKIWPAETKADTKPADKSKTSTKATTNGTGANGNGNGNGNGSHNPAEPPKQTTAPAGGGDDLDDLLS